MKVKILRNSFVSGHPVSAGGVEEVSAKQAADLINAGKAAPYQQAEKPSVAELTGKHAGRPIALLGGGPSLPADYKKIKHLDPVLIAINHHAPLHHDPPGDYMVFFDDPAKCPILGTTAKDFKGVVVTPHGEFATHYLDINYINYGMTAGLGVWLADLLGAEKILLCGMDCYTGGKNYFYGGSADYQYPGGLQEQLEFWQRLAETVETEVLAISGPLTKVFKTYRKPRKKAKK